MNKFLVFLVLCIASASCVELENLCSSDHFGYSKYDVLVNAFYRERRNITFPSLRHYLINSSITCEPSKFVNKTNFFEALRIKNSFNRKFAKFYTNDLKKATVKELEEKWLELLINHWAPMHGISETEPATCAETFSEKIYSACCIFLTLAEFSKINAYPVRSKAGFRPSYLDIIKTQEKLFEKLNAAGDGQTFALKGERAVDVFYKNGFVLLKEFKFLTEGSVQPDTESLAIYEHFLPFNSQRHTDEDCVPVKELPFFYKNKGRKPVPTLLSFD